MGWEFSSQQPIYQQIVDHILMDIVSGRYECGARMPSVRELSVQAAVNPNTMQRAMAELESRGLVTTSRNSGRFVTEDREVIKMARDEKAIEVARLFLQSMKALGYSQAQALEFLESKDLRGE